MASAKKIEEEKQELRYLIRYHSDLMNYIAGQGPFVPAMPSKESARYYKLGVKYKYDPEFESQLANMPARAKRASTTSKRDRASWAKYRY